MALPAERAAALEREVTAWRAAFQGAHRRDPGPADLPADLRELAPHTRVLPPGTTALHCRRALPQQARA